MLVVGAGAAGIAAAHQLRNFGTQVTVLEARDRLGGRINDSIEYGDRRCIGRGAQAVTGTINNPITTICYQVTLIQTSVR